MATLNNVKRNYFYPGEVYVNDDAIDNLIRYITRTKSINNKRDILVYGAAGCCDQNSIEDWIFQFKKVQELFRNDNKSPKIIHHILTFGCEETRILICRNVDMYFLSKRLAKLYYDTGHQVVFAVHYKTDCFNRISQFHIHFAINPVNYVSGNLLRTKLSSKPVSFDEKKYFRIDYELKNREALMNEMIYQAMGVKNQYYVEDSSLYMSNAYKQYGSLYKE